MNLEKLDVTTLPSNPNDLLKGNHECPCPDCDQTGSKLWIKEHFEADHRLYEQKYVMLHFINTNECEKYSTETIDGFLDDSGFDSYIKSAVKNHPIFSYELFCSILESPDNAYNESKETCRSKEHNPFTGFYQVQNLIETYNSFLENQSTQYGPNWGHTKWEIYQRDNEQCRVTGKEGNSFEDLDVHHIKPAREFIDDNGTADYDAMNDSSNLITLTKSCHGRLEGKFTDCDPDEFVEKAREYLSIEQ